MEKMIVVSMDKEYIEAVMGKMSATFGKLYELEFITEITYWEQYAQHKTEVDILLIDEAILKNYQMQLKVKSLFRLVENQESAHEGSIFKYLSINEIADKIGVKRTEKKTEIEKKTKLISIYSPCGGCGKTITALCLAKYISKQGKKVLYLNTETLQDFQCYLQTTDCIKDSVGYQLAAGVEKCADLILENVKKEEFEFVPAFEKPLFAYHMDFEKYVKLIEELLKKQIYDYLIVELSQEMQAEKMNLLCRSDEAVYVMTPIKSAISKLDKIMSLLSGTSRKGVLIYNRVKTESEQNKMDGKLKEKFAFYEEIQEYSHELTLEFCEENKLFEAVAFTVM